MNNKLTTHVCSTCNRQYGNRLSVQFCQLGHNGRTRYVAKLTAIKLRDSISEEAKEST